MVLKRFTLFGNLVTAQGEETPSYAHSFGMGKYSYSSTVLRYFAFGQTYTAATGTRAQVPVLHTSEIQPFRPDLSVVQ